MTLITTTPDEERNVALLKAIGFDRLAPAQRELALAIANRYGLDPMLKHLVMIDGGPYITRDGLLHVAHKHGALDGIEVTDPVLDADGYWRAKCSVYRKDMGRPFTYGGRYPANGRNAKFAPEMAVKVAEVMALRRAFDVAAPVLEERWDDASAQAVALDAYGSDEPASLAERVATRAAALAPSTADLGRIESDASASDDGTVAEAGVATVSPLREPMSEAESNALPYDEETELGAEAGDGDDEDEPEQASDAIEAALAAEQKLPGPTLEEFAELVKDMDKDIVKRVAKRLFPGANKFADLDPAQLQSILDGIEEGESPKPTGEVVAQCGAESPYGTGKTCSQDAGHPKSVPHRAGISETW